MADVITQIDKVKQEKKMNKENKEAIYKKVFYNLLVSILLIVYFSLLFITYKVLSQDINIYIVKISSLLTLGTAIVLFEIAHIKDRDVLIVYGIEFLVSAIITLLLSYIFYEMDRILTNLFVGIFFIIIIYYLTKSAIIYERNKIQVLRELSDIPQIIKKESKDEKAQEEKTKIKKEKTEKKEKKPSKDKSKKKNKEKK